MNRKRKIDRILISTMPRSGTVYLFEMISRIFNFEKIEPSLSKGLRPEPPEWDPYKFDRTYQRLVDGQVLCAHYTLNEEVNRMLEDDALLGVYIHRDPRDVAVSAALYIKYALKHHALHSFFSVLSDEDAICLMLAGGEVPDERGKMIHFDGIKYQCERSYDWLAHPKVAKIRYECFVRDGAEAIVKSFAEVGVVIDERALQKVESQMSFEKMASGRSAGTEDKTAHFRKGVIGDHKNYFNEMHKAICKARIGECLIDMGYEKGLMW